LILLPIQTLSDEIQPARDSAAEYGAQVLGVPEPPFLEMMLGVAVTAQRLDTV